MKADACQTISCSNHRVLFPQQHRFGAAWTCKKKNIGPDNSHVTNFSRLRLSIEKQEGKRKYESDGGVMVDEFVCVCAYVCACTGE